MGASSSPRRRTAASTGMSDKPTLSLCTRCLRHFPARQRCPYCADLRIEVSRALRETGGVPSWVFAVVRDRPGGGVDILCVAAGFATGADAAGAAQGFVRETVTERFAGGVQT